MWTRSVIEWPVCHFSGNDKYLQEELCYLSAQPDRSKNRSVFLVGCFFPTACVMYKNQIQSHVSKYNNRFMPLQWHSAGGVNVTAKVTLLERRWQNCY